MLLPERVGFFRDERLPRKSQTCNDGMGGSKEDDDAFQMTTIMSDGVGGAIEVVVESVFINATLGGRHGRYGTKATAG
jgi:hypothetical protein